MRRILLPLLLLAVFFHTAVGMPWHAAQHLPGHAHHSTHLQTAQRATQDSAAPAQQVHQDDTAPTHGTCAWCQAQAQQGHALAAPWAGEGPAAAIAEPRIWHTAALPTTPGQRWPFASRDPPRHSF